MLTNPRVLRVENERWSSLRSVKLEARPGSIFIRSQHAVGQAVAALRMMAQRLEKLELEHYVFVAGDEVPAHDNPHVISLISTLRAIEICDSDATILRHLCGEDLVKRENSDARAIWRVGRVFSNVEELTMRRVWDTDPVQVARTFPGA